MVQKLHRGFVLQGERSKHAIDTWSENIHKSFDNYCPTCSQRMGAPWQTIHIPETKSVAHPVSPAAVASSLLAVKVYGAEQMESPNKYIFCNDWIRDVLYQN